ncbi:Uma2 family endonuclease [Novipirellula sp. SH528]|uniref:Uma2 family endonuclease n=1 Tax=Novipirellula sp. SH528 TaxID=3454466 RepID=UPI003F9EE5EA
MPIPQYIPHYTATDYQQWEGDWELWNGIPVAMTPSPFGPHQTLLAKLAHRFISAIEASGCENCEVVLELDWIVSQHTVVRPDLSIVCHANLDRFIERPPSLVVEILSPSTSQRDRTVKRDLYEQQGVLHYLIANPDDATYLWYQLNEQSQYMLIKAVENIKPKLHADCHLEVFLP